MKMRQRAGKGHGHLCIGISFFLSNDLEAWFRHLSEVSSGQKMRQRAGKDHCYICV